MPLNITINGQANLGVTTGIPATIQVQMGVPGAAATVQVGATTTGDAGTDASVVNVGSSSNAILDFTIPRGDKGDQGIQGIQGIQGVKGDKGDQGIQGEQGDKGDTGPGVAVGGTTGQALVKLSNADFATGWSTINSASWGNITGTLSNQTDLQGALDGKLSLTGGTMAANALVHFPADGNGNFSEVGAWGLGITNNNTGNVASIEANALQVKLGQDGTTITDGSVKITQPYEEQVNASYTEIKPLVFKSYDYGSDTYITIAPVNQGSLANQGIEARTQNVQGFGLRYDGLYVFDRFTGNRQFELGLSNLSFRNVDGSNQITNCSFGFDGLKFQNGTTQTTAFIPGSYAPIASPTFTGDPKAPTPLTADNDTSIATTAFVKNQGYITSSALTPYLTISSASSTYQTIAGMSSYLTTANAASTYQTISGMSSYATQTFVTSQGYITSSALTPYLTSSVAASTYQTISGMSDYLTTSSAAFTYQTLSGMSSYAQLAGATFTGKVIAPANSTNSGLNIGSTLLTTPPTNLINGDIWLQDTGTPPTVSPKLYFRANNSTFNVATVGTSNIFSRNQTINASTGGSFNLDITQSGNGGGLRITNTGTGESLRVEDDTSPDSTAFVVSNNGRTGIGVAPDASVALSVDSTGVKFSDASIQVTKGDRYKATSTTSMVIDGANSKVFQTQPNLAYTKFQHCTIYPTAGTTQVMYCHVNSYNATTGALDVDSVTHTGSGTFADWVINVGS
jgi:hypothetical protein